MMSGTSMMAGMGWPGLLVILLLWGGVIALTLWGVSAEADALEILRRRYAQGEISREEFLQASETLYSSELKRPGHAHGHPGGRGR
jgi:uncharacterized membrane protein